MKTLFLMRHAHACTPEMVMLDATRDLTDKGIEKASSMGEFLQAKHSEIQAIISSSAKRAVRTAEQVANVIGYDINQIHTEEIIYKADAEDLENVIEHFPEELDTILLVAHNPSITELAHNLGATDIENMSPGTIVAFSFSVQHWFEVSADKSKLLFVEY